MAHKKVVVIGLDGVPYPFLQKLFAEGKLHYLKTLSEKGTFTHMNSSYPPISSSAWASFMTGKNPGAHNIYGFVDKNDNQDIFIPTSTNMTSQTLWEYLSDQGKKVVVMNVPVTYPPRDVNGTLIAGFLCPCVDELSNNKEVIPFLKDVGYKIDADALLANESKDKFLDEIYDVFEKRKQTMFTLLEKEEWDFFMCHVMETDRLNHFFWGEMESNHETYYPKFMEFMENVDNFVKELHEKLDDDTALVLLSDHGFCTIKTEYQMNKALLDAGFLTLQENHADKEMLHKIDYEKTKAYSLIPGRFYITNKANYDVVRNELITFLEDLKDDDGTKIIQSIVKKEDVYSGEAYDKAPDLVAIPTDGYDLKAHVSATSLKEKGLMTGMHTFDNCFLLIDQKHDIKKEERDLADVMPTLLTLFGLDIPKDLTGKSII